MNKFIENFELIQPYLPILIVLVLWDSVWKLIGLWRAGRNNELLWFIGIAFINSIGILPIIYILLNRRKK